MQVINRNPGRVANIIGGYLIALGVLLVLQGITKLLSGYDFSQREDVLSGYGLSVLCLSIFTLGYALGALLMGAGLLRRAPWAYGNTILLGLVYALIWFCDATSTREALNVFYLVTLVIGLLIVVVLAGSQPLRRMFASHGEQG